MKWKFKLQALLKFRSQLTDEAMSVYAEAKGHLDAGLKELDRLYTEVDENFQNTQRAREKGGETAEVLKTHDEFFAGQQIRIEKQRQKVRQLKEIAEEKHEILVQRTMEKKAIEKLEEKQRAAHRDYLKKKEQTELDDLVVMRQGRGTVE